MVFEIWRICFWIFFNQCDVFSTQMVYLNQENIKSQLINHTFVFTNGRSSNKYNVKKIFSAIHVLKFRQNWSNKQLWQWCKISVDNFFLFFFSQHFAGIRQWVSVFLFHARPTINGLFCYGAVHMHRDSSMDSFIFNAYESSRAAFQHDRCDV